MIDSARPWHCQDVIVDLSRFVRCAPLFALTLGLAACAVDVGSGGDTGTGTETGTTTEGEANLCEDASDDPPVSTAITVRVLNTRDEPIWLPGADCLSFSRFELEVEGVVGKDVPDAGEACGLVLQTSACGTLGCEGDGMEGGVIRLGPGASREFILDAYYYPMVEVPGSCQTQGECGEPLGCRAGRAIPDGVSLTIRTVAHASCVDEFDSGMCECESGETCSLEQGVFNLGQALEGESSVDGVGEADEVVIEFG